MTGLALTMERRRGSNPRPRPWQGRALPAEPRPHRRGNIILERLCSRKPSFLKVLEFSPTKGAASARRAQAQASAIRPDALFVTRAAGTGCERRTLPLPSRAPLPAACGPYPRFASPPAARSPRPLVRPTRRAQSPPPSCAARRMRAFVCPGPSADVLPAFSRCDGGFLKRCFDRAPLSGKLLARWQGRGFPASVHGRLAQGESTTLTR